MSNDINVTDGAILEILNGKLDLDGGNFIGSQLERQVDQRLSGMETNISGKLDKSTVKAYVTQTYVSGTSWYRIWSDKWCEQGGQIKANGSYSVTYLKPFKDANYTISNQSLETANSGTGQESQRGTAKQSGALTSITNTGFTSVYGLETYSWYACGYIA